MDLINWGMLKEPINWVIVFLMLAIGAALLHLLMGGHGGASIPQAS